MLIRRADEMEGTKVAMDGAKDVTMRLLMGRADGAPNFAVRCFTVEPGGHSPRHSHNYEHEAFILEGQARVEHDGDFHDVRAGDALLVEPNKIHQFVNSGDVPMSFLCIVPLEFDCGEGKCEAVPGS